MSTNSFGSGTVYYSEDNLKTLVPDTMGLPQFLSGVVAPIGMQYHRGKVIVNLGSSGYWLKDTADQKWGHIDPPTSLNGGKDPICFYGDSMFAHDNTGANEFYVSGDYGQTWIKRKSNLPSFFLGNMLVANSETGRLYLVGAKSDGSLYGVYYTDDNGFNWVREALSSFIGTDVNGGQQEITAMNAKGKEVFVALENGRKNSTPDVFSSINGITNMEYDTSGLLNDPSGLINGVKFVNHKGAVMLSLNVRDVYTRGEAVNALSNLSMDNVGVYPNPTTGVLTIPKNLKCDELRIIDNVGNVVLTTESYSVNIGHLPSGYYLVEVVDRENLKVVRTKVLKE